MRFLEGYRNREVAEGLLREIRALDPQPVRIMEICGGHTHALLRYGLPDLLPPAIRFLHGPGCPVCVTPAERIDEAIALGHQGVIIASYGDMLRVPGSRGSLLAARREGADVRLVYSPLDALALARQSDRPVVFLAIGFETTAPAHGATVLRARREGIRNFHLLTHQVRVPPILRALLEDPEVGVDAFIGPGHVASITGWGDLRFVAERYGRPVVVSGFEPVDLLESILRILRLRQRGEVRVENQYGRVVAEEGNGAARAVLEQVFEPATVSWRGIGPVPDSGLVLREEFAAFDARRALDLPRVEREAEEVPHCGAVIRGRLDPRDCPHFGRSCHPDHPLGAGMVSAEGACAAYMTYRPVAAGGGGGR